MATIDKSLPNTMTEVEIPGEEEIVEAREEAVEELSTEGKTEIEIDEEGGATINFDPKEVTPEGGEDHDANLAEYLEDDVLGPLASQLMDQYNTYKETRGDWEESYREGLSLLGFKYVTRTEPFRGASSVTHPVLSGSCYTISSSSLQRIITCRRSS